MMKEVNPIKKFVRDFRRAGSCAPLREEDAPAEPFALFEEWMKAAIGKEDFEPNAMTLATASPDGTPTARTVLLKDYGPEGFVFFTNFNSRKGENLAANPRASLVFYWGSLSRQVLIDGVCEKAGRAAAEEYFRTRPRGSQLAAWASDQSRPVESRAGLEARVRELDEKYKGKDVPCPENWGGFLLVPARVEFWQGRPDRLHDRLCYTRQAGGWKRERLAP